MSNETPGGSGGSISSGRRSSRVLPKKMGRYEIISELGVGSMGVVYKARDPNINRYVALKTINFSLPLSEKEEQEFRARFFREAQAAGNLTHPNIIQIYDAGEDYDTGTAYIAMEFAAGATLRDFMGQESLLPLDKVLDIMKQLGRALAYAHKHGVIHRDIKPANLILTTGGELKVTDFGIARIPHSSLTVTGRLLGTPYYMAPELLMGRDFDHRCDLFGTGIIFYQLLTGQMPFTGTSVAAVSYQIVHSPPAPIRKHRLEGVPPEVEAAVLKLLAKDPGQRYSSAADMVDDLEAYERKVIMRESRTPTFVLLWRWLKEGPPARLMAPILRSKPRLAAASAAVLLAAAAAAFFAMRGTDAESPQAAPAENPHVAAASETPMEPPPSVEKKPEPAAAKTTAKTPSSQPAKTPAKTEPPKPAPESQKTAPAAKASPAVSQGRLRVVLQHPFDRFFIAATVNGAPLFETKVGEGETAAKSGKKTWDAVRSLKPGHHRITLQVEGWKGKRDYVQSCEQVVDLGPGESWRLAATASFTVGGKDRLVCRVERDSSAGGD